MISEFKKHQLRYLLLINGLILLIFLFFVVWPNRDIQRLISLSIAAFYFLWGMLTHLQLKKINYHIIFEYLTISILAGLLIFLITL